VSKTNAFETALLQLLFQNADAHTIGDPGGLRGSVSAGVFRLSLHTADPGEAGDQATSETSYTGYARVPVARTAGAWNVSGAVASNAAAITFPSCTAGTSVITHVGVGVSVSGGGYLLFRGALSSPITVIAGKIPTIEIGALTIEEG
jgi:hypothetical protein